MSDGHVVGQVGSPVPRFRARVRVKAGVMGAGCLGHARVQTCCSGRNLAGAEQQVLCVKQLLGCQGVS